jgi:hypothetical protein
MPALLQREACLLTGSWHACCMHPPAVVPPIDQWLNSYYFTVDGVNFPTSWVNLMYVGTDPTGVLLNGASVPAADWSRAAGLANWWTARKQLTVTAGTEVTYTLRHTNASETLGFIGSGSMALAQAPVLQCQVAMLCVTCACQRRAAPTGWWRRGPPVQLLLTSTMAPWTPRAVQ